MKRRIVIALLVAAWLLLLLPRSISGQPTLPPEHGINVTIDPRIELIATVQALYEGYPLVTRYDFNYKREVLKRFAPFVNHPAEKLFQEMAPNGFNFYAPPEVMLYLSAPPDLKVNKAIPEELVKRAGGKEKLMQFIDALRQFAKESNFMEFFRSHAPFYQEVLSNERAKLAGIDVRVIEKYYGVRQHTYNIIVSPLLHNGGFGPRVAYKDGLYDIYSINGTVKVEKDNPTFGTLEDFRYIVWHEFSHSFVNPMVEKHVADVARYSSLLTPIETQMRREGYKSWQTVVLEHIVRAVTVRLSYRERGKEAGDRALKDETKRGYAYLGNICERLKEYEAHRRQYRTLDSFWPELLKAFEQSEQRPPSEDGRLWSGARANKVR
jgi:Domain of unknown function (DUF4932)